MGRSRRDAIHPAHAGIWEDGGCILRRGQPTIVKAFRKVIGLIKDAMDERDFYMVKSLHYEKPHGMRSHQRSVRVNQQFRLTVELEGHGKKTAVVISIEKNYE
jgi:toxin HigB-1